MNNSQTATCSANGLSHKCDYNTPAKQTMLNTVEFGIQVMVISIQWRHCTTTFNSDTNIRVSFSSYQSRHPLRKTGEDPGFVKRAGDHGKHRAWAYDGGLGVQDRAAPLVGSVLEGENLLFIFIQKERPKDKGFTNMIAHPSVRGRLYLAEMTSPNFWSMRR